MKPRLDNSCELDCDIIKGDPIVWQIKQDILFIKSIDQLKRKFPEFEFSYIENDKFPKGFDVCRKVNDKTYIVAKWREK